MQPQTLIEKISKFVLLGAIGFVIADLATMYLRSGLYPTPPPPTMRSMAQPMVVSTANFGAITSRNIFNADGKIASPIGAGEPGKPPADAPPVPSQLPIQLVGTIVHVNPARSVATLNLKGKGDQVAVRVDGVIPDNVATVTKIERSKITFRNNATQRLEYIEMVDESKITFATGGPSPGVQQVGEVTKRGDTDFELRREDINKLTSNLPELLQQARAVPRMGPNGIECFSLADIMPGSIYERLGLQRGDCIKSVNGERIDSPAKAMELYNALRANANSINLGVDRGGRDQNFNYNITN